LVANAMTPDLGWIAVGGKDGQIRVWEWQKPKSKPAILEGHKGPVRTLAFGPDGRWLASGGEDHVLRLWLHHPNDEDLMTLACQRASRNLTPEEWRQYLGKRPYRETCPR